MRIHQLGRKVLPGIFLGHALVAGGIWKGDIVVAERPKNGENFIFLLADGEAKLCGRYLEVRESFM